MAGNKGRKGLDQSAGNTLSAIDRALLDLIEKPIQDDEFTVDMVAAKSDVPRATISGRLSLMVKAGKLTKRKIRMNTTPTNVYRYVD
jgi:hypothetical protein